MGMGYPGPVPASAMERWDLSGGRDEQMVG